MKRKSLFIFTLALLLFVLFQFGELFYKISSKQEYNNTVQNLGEEVIGEIYGAIEVGQSFISNEDNISSVEVLMGTFGRNNFSTIEYGIKDNETGQIIEVHNEDAFLVKDNEYHKFKFNNLKNTKNREYYFYIKIPDADYNNSVTIYKSKSDAYKDGYLYLNGKSENGDMALKINSKEAYPRTYTVIIIFVGLLGLVFFWYIACRIKSFKIENVVFTLILAFGIIMMFIMPPLQAPDEPVHFYRAYEISQGGMVTDNTSEGVGSYLPKSIQKMEDLLEAKRISFNPYEKVNFEGFKEALKEPLNKNDKEFYVYPSAAVYAPVQYIPQSIGIALGNLLNLPVLMVFYLGRLANLIVWALLIRYALKIVPFGKNILAITALFPVCLQQAASISPDAMLNGISILFIAYTLSLSESKEELNIKHKLLILAMAVFITLSKIVYLPIVLILFLIPKERFKNGNHYVIFIVLVGIISLLITGSWMKYVDARLGLDFAPFLGVNTGMQIKYALTHPFRYAFIIRNTLFMYSEAYIEGAIGNLGWLDTMLPYSVIYSLFFTSIFVSVTSDMPKHRKQRILFIFIFVTSALLILSSLYAGWTPVAHEIIAGVQGRYFIPVIPLLLMFIPNLKVQMSRANFNRYLYVYINWTLLYTMLIVIERYYI